MEIIHVQQCTKCQRWLIHSSIWRFYVPVAPYPGVLAGAQFKFAQRVTLETSNILTPRFPWSRIFTNHIGVSDIGRPKALLFYRPDTARALQCDMRQCRLLHPQRSMAAECDPVVSVFMVPVESRGTYGLIQWYFIRSIENFEAILLGPTFIRFL